MRIRESDMFKRAPMTVRSQLFKQSNVTVQTLFIKRRAIRNTSTTSNRNLESIFPFQLFAQFIGDVGKVNFPLLRNTSIQKFLHLFGYVPNLGLSIGSQTKLEEVLPIRSADKLSNGNERFEITIQILFVNAFTCGHVNVIVKHLEFVDDVLSQFLDSLVDALLNLVGELVSAYHSSLFSVPMRRTPTGINDLPATSIKGFRTRGSCIS